MDVRNCLSTDSRLQSLRYSALFKEAAHQAARISCGKSLERPPDSKFWLGVLFATEALLGGIPLELLLYESKGELAGLVANDWLLCSGVLKLLAMRDDEELGLRIAYHQLMCLRQLLGTDAKKSSARVMDVQISGIGTEMVVPSLGVDIAKPMVWEPPDGAYLKRFFAAISVALGPR